MLVVRYEGPRGGPLATFRDGDVIEMDIANRVLTVHLGEDEPQARLDEWVPTLNEIP
ncbi:MAG: dihydroxy-acid dehydratase [Anaerolineae bacterium]|nr:dihydroxy-acid dehydratase [Anaerolineae bacterium]